MTKFYKIGNVIVSEGNIRTHSRIDVDGQLIVFTTYKIDAGSPENAKRALDAIARVIGAEDLLASDADEEGDEKPAMAEPDVDGWIMWDGGECPVDENTDVKYRTRGGYEGIRAAGLLFWGHEGGEFDTIAYRLVPEAPATAEPDADGWIPWAGGECPVDGNAEVQIRFRTETTVCSGLAGNWRWGHGPKWDRDADIVAYRSVAEQPCETR